MKKYFFTSLFVLLPAVSGHANGGADNGMDSKDKDSMGMDKGAGSSTVDDLLFPIVRAGM
jgi:hypothetical protein